MILWFRKLFSTRKLLTKSERNEPENSSHRFGDNYLTDHLVKFLQGRIKPCRIGALRVSTGFQSF